VSRHYPALLDLRDTPVLVVGGGAVAARRVAGLVDADARPVVIAPEVESRLDAQIVRSGLTLHRREYRSGDAAGYRVVMAVTDRREVNALVARDAAATGAWVSVVDDPETSTFQVPAMVRAGVVTVAVSTGGASPLLAARLRDRVARTVTPALGAASERLLTLRSRVRERWPDDEAKRRAFWVALITDEFLDQAIEGRVDELENRIEACLSQS
jgi:siroheme synthase-like protein